MYICIFKNIPIALESGLSESSPLGVAPPTREEALWDLGVVPVPDRLTALTPCGTSPLLLGRPSKVAED